MPAEVKQEQSPSNQTSLAMMQEPQEVVEETVTIEEDPGTPTSRVSVVTSEDGTTRRTETKDNVTNMKVTKVVKTITRRTFQPVVLTQSKPSTPIPPSTPSETKPVTKMVKTVTTRTVRQVPMGPDGLPLPEGSSPLGSYTDSIDRRYMKNGERFITPQATSTLTRSYNNYSDSYNDTPDSQFRHYGLHDGYGDMPENYGSLSRGVNYRPYRPYMPTGGYRPENSYTLPIRKEDYGHVAQPQVPMGSSTVDLNRSQPERFQPEPYGLEDDRRSLGPDDEEAYDLEPDYSTANRRTLPGRTIREPLRNGPRVRNVSSDGAEARRRLRECEGLVDALLHALLSAVGKKDMDNKSVENCVCIMRNLSYHVHKEIPGAEKFQDPSALQAPGSAGTQRKKKDDAGCFGGKKAKEEWFNQGFELLYQPEVVRLYLSLLTESQNYNTLEAAAGALQNLSAGQWTWSNYIRATVRKEKGLPILVELLRSDSDKVVRAVAIALRNLSIDRRNKDLIGSYAMRDLVSNLPSGQQRPAKNLEEDTVVAILNTIHEIITDSSENARSLITAQAIDKLVAINRTSQSARETKAASHVLQTVWSYKELRNGLTKDGWNKTHFQPTATGTPKGSKSCKPGYDDTTLPLMEKNQGNRGCSGGDMIPMDELGPGKTISACPQKQTLQTNMVLVPPLHYGAVSLIFSTEAASSPSLTDNYWTEAEDGVLFLSGWKEVKKYTQHSCTHTQTRTVITHITRSAASMKTSVNAARTGRSRLKVEGSVAACLKSHAEGADTPIMITELLCFLFLSLDGYSTIDQRDKESKYKSSDGSSDLQEREPLKNDTNRKHYIRSNRPTVSLVDACDVKPQPVDSWV
ncbi:unnamed protein product [Leuciscus chuanchicus]